MPSEKELKQECELASMSITQELIDAGSLPTGAAFRFEPIQAVNNDGMSWWFDKEIERLILGSSLATETNKGD